MPKRLGFSKFKSQVREDTRLLYTALPQANRLPGTEPTYDFMDKGEYWAEAELPLVYPGREEPVKLKIEIETDRKGRTSWDYRSPVDEELPWDIEAMIEGGGLYSFLGLFNDSRH